MEDIKIYKEMMNFEFITILNEAIETHIKENGIVNFNHLNEKNKRSLFKSHIKNRLKHHFNNPIHNSINKETHNSTINKLISSTAAIIELKRNETNHQELIKNAFEIIDSINK
jgi:hypothetical protein